MHQLLLERIVMVVLVFFATSRVAGAAGKFPALFAFGDSIFDTGNNNNLETTTKSNFPPYGRNFIGGKPTGRFSDGKIPSDLIAKGLGIKEILPAFLDPNLQPQELATGVSFASAGSGNDDLTANILGVLSLSEQLEKFREYIGKLKAGVGEEEAANITSNSLYLVSAGNNDIAITYATTIRRSMFFHDYSNLLVTSATNFIKELHAIGARRIWVLSTLPLGCLPGGRTAGGGPFRLCDEIVNGEAQFFNAQLALALNSLQPTLPGSFLQFLDFYTPFLNIINNPASSGFVNVANGCCGTGLVEIGETCNVAVGTCPDPAAYLFWDVGHPCQRGYEIVVSSILKNNNASA